MRLIYDLSNGRIFAAVWSRDWLSFKHSINVPIGIFIVDEITENRDLLADLARYVGKKDADELGKYYIDPDGDLFEREGWMEAEHGQS